MLPKPIPGPTVAPSVATRARSPWESMLQAGGVKACTGGNCFVVYSKIKCCPSQSTVGGGVAEYLGVILSLMASAECEMSSVRSFTALP